MVLGIYGASGLGMEFETVATLVQGQQNRWEDIVFIDDDATKVGTTLLGRMIFSRHAAADMFGDKGIEFIVAMGEPFLREKIYSILKSEGLRCTNLIHPTVSCGKDLELGDGIIAGRYCSLTTKAKIGNNVLIQALSTMGHGVQIGDNSIISSFDFIGGGTVIGSNTYIAPHCCLRNGIRIGSNSIIGMGSVVTKDIPDGVVAYGNPCRIVRANEKGKVFC